MSNKKWSDSSTFAFIAVLFVCLVYFIGYFSLLPWVKPCDSPLGIYDPARYLSCKSVNELGDALAGLFAPVAFIVLVAALFIQSRELKAQREELNETQGLLTKQIEVSERQAEAAYAQVEAAVQQAKEAKASMELQREQAHYLKSVEELRDQKARTDRTLQFFREFCSREMALARNEASLFVKDHRALELHGNEFDSTLERMSVPVWIVARFFQSLWVHIKNHSVDNASTSELFGSIFIWWHVNYLSTALYEGWKITSDLQDFEGWLRSSVDPSEFERWEYEAQADMERIERVKIPRTTDDLDPNATA